MKNIIKNIILWFSAIVLAICLISSFFVTIDFSADKTDLLLYRTSGILLMVTLEIGVLLEMNIFNLRKKIPLIRSTNIFKHLLFWIVVVVLACVLFSIPYNMTSANFRNQLDKNEDVIITDNDPTEVKTGETSVITEQENDQNDVPETNKQTHNDVHDDINTNTDVPQSQILTWKLLSGSSDRYKLTLTLLGEHFNKRVYSDSDYLGLSEDEKQLVKDLFDYTNKKNELPKDFTETFTAFCVGDEFEDMFLEAYDNTFYNALSNSFIISWKSDNTYYIDIRDASEETSTNIDEFVVEESPLTYVFDETAHIVGNCSIILKKVEIVNTVHKASHGSATYAKYIRVQATVKNNSSQETYLTSKKDGQFFIGKYYGINEETKIGWNDNYKWKVDSDIKSDYGWTVKPNQSRDICVSGVFIDSDRLKYSDTPQIDLYFVNDGDTLTITIN